MVTVDDLRIAWPVRYIPGYGTCIVVPASRFEKCWEASLKAQGVVVLYQMLPGGPCALVRVKDKSSDSSKPRVVFEPKRDEHKLVQDSRALLDDCKFLRWTKEEDARLIKRMGELNGSISHRCGVLSKEFKRPLSGLTLRFYMLKNKRLVESNEKEAPKLPIAVHTPLPTALANGLHEILVEIQDEVLAMVKEHGDFRSLHEGYAVVLEELDELWDEVKRSAEKRDLSRLRSEALDVAASAAKLALFVERKGLEVSS